MTPLSLCEALFFLMSSFAPLSILEEASFTLADVINQVFTRPYRARCASPDTYAFITTSPFIREEKEAASAEDVAR